MEELRAIGADESIIDFCELTKEFYVNESSDAVLLILQKFIQKYPSFMTSYEWLGYIYSDMSMWNNAIACFEKIENPQVFNLDEFYWMLVWASGKVKNYADEENYYRKCMEIDPERKFLRNNLGYCLYRQKRYDEAKKIFD